MLWACVLELYALIFFGSGSKEFYTLHRKIIFILWDMNTHSHDLEFSP